mmetsp:Transcript_53859/g.158535  ORF Transcript_53859/g.158535 Transcript_53859/m.158535 type:complete len:225 (+) Transcript_53859:392-1066(+)
MTLLRRGMKLFMDCSTQGRLASVMIRMFATAAASLRSSTARSARVSSRRRTRLICGPGSICVATGSLQFRRQSCLTQVVGKMVSSQSRMSIVFTLSANSDWLSGFRSIISSFLPAISGFCSISGLRDGPSGFGFGILSWFADSAVASGLPDVRSPPPAAALAGPASALSAVAADAPSSSVDSESPAAEGRRSGAAFHGGSSRQPAMSPPCVEGTGAGLGSMPMQ